MMNTAGSFTMIKLLFFCASVIAAIALAAFLLIGSKHKEYAIMRSLGATKRKAERSLYVPLCAIAIIALMAGNAFAHAFALNTIEKALSLYEEIGFDTNAAIPASTSVICILMQFAVLFFFVMLNLRRMGRKKILELLQIRVNRNYLKAKAPWRRSFSATDAAEGINHIKRYRTLKSSGIDLSNVAGENSNQSKIRETTNDKNSVSDSRSTKLGRVNHTLLHVWRRVYRAPIKPLLTIILTLLLFGSIGQLTIVRGIYRSIYENINIRAMFNSSLSLRSATQVDESEYVKQPYYEYVVKNKLDCNDMPVQVVMTNNVHRYNDHGEDVIFADGYDESSFSAISRAENNICMLDNGFMRENGLSLGDEVLLSPLGLRAECEQYYITGEEDESELVALIEFIDKVVEDVSVYFTIVGCISDDGTFGVSYTEHTMYVAVGRGLNREFNPLLDEQIVFDLVEYTLVSPGVADEFQDFARSRIADTIGRISVNTGTFVMDTSEAENMLRMLSLLDSFYPIALAAAMLVGCFIAGFITLQASRETSIMRVLGTTKRGIFIMLYLEQTAVCVLGLLCAVTVLFAINKELISEFTVTLVLCAAGYLLTYSAGSTICMLITMRRSPLELLQVKE